MSCYDYFRKGCMIAGQLITASLIALLGIACTKDKPVSPAARPHYLRIYSLRDKPDETHSVAIQDSSNKVWYRGTAPAFDLNDFVYGDISREYPGDKPAVVLPLSVGSNVRMYEWSSAQIGYSIGIVIEDRLIAVHRIVAAFDGRLRIPVRSVEERESISMALRAGGVAAGSRAADRE